MHLGHPPMVRGRPGNTESRARSTRRRMARGSRRTHWRARSCSGRERPRDRWCGARHRRAVSRRGKPTAAFTIRSHSVSKLAVDKNGKGVERIAYDGDEVSKLHPITARRQLSGRGDVRHGRDGGAGHRRRTRPSGWPVSTSAPRSRCQPPNATHRTRSSGCRG